MDLVNQQLFNVIKVVWRMKTQEEDAALVSPKSVPLLVPYKGK